MFPSSRNSESIISRNLNGLTVLIQARQRQSLGRTRPRRHRTLSLRPRRGLPLRDRAQPRPRTLLPHPRQYHSRLGRLIPCGGSPTPPARVLHPRAPASRSARVRRRAPFHGGRLACCAVTPYHVVKMRRHSFAPRF